MKKKKKNNTITMDRDELVKLVFTTINNRLEEYGKKALLQALVWWKWWNFNEQDDFESLLKECQESYNRIQDKIETNLFFEEE